MSGYGVIKVGGSLITNKQRCNAFARARTRRLANAVATLGEPVVLVHGTGSFGKPQARTHEYLDGFLAAQRRDVVAKVEHNLAQLRARVLAELRAAGLPVYGLSAAALMVTSDGRPEATDFSVVRALLDRGMVPVISGAIVPDRQRGFAVCSSDTLAACMAVALRARFLLFATDVPGVMLSDGKRSVVAREYAVDIASGLQRVAGDVSGGMEGKLRAAQVAVACGIPTWVVDGARTDRMAAVIRGRPVVATRLVTEATSARSHNRTKEGMSA